jgi:xylulokinase
MREGLLAVDLGTSGVKVGVVGVDGVLISFAERRYPLIEGGGVGWFEQDPREWWSASRVAMREAVAHAKGTRVIAVCIGGQGPSVVPIDERGEPLANAIIWMDRRTEDERRAMSQRLGSEVSAYSNIPRAMWLRIHRPELEARTRWFLQSWDFIAHRLTGTPVASSFVGATVFPPAHLAAAELDPRKFPPELVMGEVGGVVRPEAARDLGVDAGIPVGGGVNDSTATVLGGGLVRKGLALDLGGTSGGIALAWDTPIGDRGLTAWPAPTPGLFVCGGPLASAGRALGWLMAATGYGPNDYAEIERDAAAVAPGSDGLVFVPYLAGERTPLWDDRARGMFFGLRERHTRAHLARAMFEGVAFSVRHIVDTLRDGGAQIEEVRVVGGQAKVRLWARIKADVLATPVVIPTITEGSVLGEAVLAAVAAKRFPDLQTGAAGFMKEAARFAPDPANAAVYERQYRVYRELYPRLGDLMRAL